ncbi:MAG: DUF2239 family protein [Spirochaetales bacterium]|nr:DUF2239 family protein [Spirochaetales bacterium]
MNENKSYTTFYGFRHIVTGDLETILKETYPLFQEQIIDQVLIFDNSTGRQIDFDFHGRLEEVLEKNLPKKSKSGPGRPSLGVTSAEVSLLPGHWDWLQAQPKRASGTIRNLVEKAIINEPPEERRKRQINAAGQFLWAIAGNLPEFEETTRALYAKKWTIVDLLTRSWPEDIQKHLGFMLSEARNPFSGGNVHHLRTLLVLDSQYKAKDQEKKQPWQLSAVNLAASIANGCYSALEVMEAFFQRIKVVNKEINAITTLFEEEALEKAAEIDRKRAAGKEVGPFAGVPLSIKGNLDVAGYATTNGIAALEKALAPKDCPVVRRLRDAGAIPVGHSNLPDMSLRFHTSSQLYGATLNPWNKALTPGGSSGGEGAALAAGLSALGIGNDAGGSVRVPALFNGIAALKPSYGRFPADNSIGPRDLTLASQLIPVDGFLARSVADLHIAFQIAAGTSPVDPRTVPAPLFFDHHSEKLRVALVTDPGGLGVSKGVLAACEKAGEILSRHGYEVESAQLPKVKEICDAYGKMIFTEFYQNLPVFQRLLGKDGQRYIELAMELQKPEDLHGYIQLAALRQGFQRQWSQFFTEYDLILGPVFTEEVPPPDYDIRGAEEHKALTQAMRLCSASSFIGVPAVAVPTGLENSMPTGVQIIAAMYQENMCLEAAAVIENALGVFTPIDPR